MWKQKTELTEVDAPELEGRDVELDPATELPAPTAEEELEDQQARRGRGQTQAQLEQLNAERDRLLDRLARLQAEFENARKRAERERAEQRDFVTAGVVEQFLPVVDNFELALKSTGTEKQLRSGVSLIVKQMEEILGKMQVRRFRRWASISIRAFMRRWERWSATTCRISMWPKRCGAATRFARGCCGPRWCAWRTMRNK